VIVSKTLFPFTLFSDQPLGKYIPADCGSGGPRTRRRPPPLPGNGGCQAASDVPAYRAEGRPAHARNNPHHPTTQDRTGPYQRIMETISSGWIAGLGDLFREQRLARCREKSSGNAKRRRGYQANKASGPEGSITTPTCLQHPDDARPPSS